MSKQTFCNNCGLYKNKYYQNKSIQNKYMVVNLTWDRGVVFGTDFWNTQDGIFLKEILADSFIDYKDVYYTTLIKCYDDKLDINALRICTTTLDKEIQEINPKVIIGLGDIVANYFLKTKSKVTTLRSKFYTYKDYTFLPVYDLQYIKAAKMLERYRVAVQDFSLSKKYVDEYYDYSYKKTNYVVPKKDEFNLVKLALGKLQKVDAFSFDWETTGLDEYNNSLISISFSWQEFTAISIPLFYRTERFNKDSKLLPYWTKEEMKCIYQAFKIIFSRRDCIKIAQNFGFEDRWMFEKMGIDIQLPIFDTLLSSFIEMPFTFDKGKSFGLGKLASRFKDSRDLKDIWDDLKKIKKADRDLSVYHSVEKINKYGCGDSDVTFRLYINDSKNMMTKPYNNFYYNRLMPTVKFTERKRRNGIYLDKEYLQDSIADFKKDEDKLLRVIKDKIGDKNFNLNSSQQLSNYLFKVLGHPKIKGNSVDKDVLNKLRDQHGVVIAGDILEYRSLSKLRVTHLEGLLNAVNSKTGRVHANFKLHGTEPGRISCSNPNLLNIPTRVGVIVKRAIIPPPGYVMFGADYSQIELRLIAWFSQDPVLLDAFNRGIDTHILTASEIYGINIEDVTKEMRQAGKTANFRNCYGGGAQSFVNGMGNKLLGVDADMSEKVSNDRLLSIAKPMVDAYFRLYKGIKPWGKKVIAQAREDRFTVTEYGRIRRIVGLHSRNTYLRSRAEKQAVNSNPQGTAADYQSFRFQDIIVVTDKRGLGAEPALDVYDAIYGYCPENNVDEVSSIIKEIGVLKDESNIGVPMILEPEFGKDLGEVS